MAASPSSLARRMKDCRVEMMPSASVVLRIKSTATSLPASPAIRSTCTTAKRPASWMRRTMEEMLQISPYNTNTTRIFSLVSALRSPASSLTAAMTGVSRMASISSCFMLFLLPGVLWGNFLLVLCQPAQRHIGVGCRAAVQDAVVKAHLGVVLTVGVALLGVASS